MRQPRLLVRTVNSLYEVLLRSQRFRRIEGPSRGVPPLAVWWPFHRLGPVVPGQPMRLWRLRGQAGRVSQLDVVTTAPVVEVDLTADPVGAASADERADGGARAGGSGPGRRASRPTLRPDGPDAADGLGPEPVRPDGA